MVEVPYEGPPKKKHTVDPLTGCYHGMIVLALAGLALASGAVLSCLALLQSIG